MLEDPNIALEAMRNRINGGARMLLDRLSDEELVAAHALIREGEAEIIHEACKPFVVRVLAPPTPLPDPSAEGGFARWPTKV